MDLFQTIPTILGDDRYAVGSLIRAGTMSRVHDGTDVRTGKRVALKLLEGGFADATIKQRFLAEIRALAEISHPRIVQILGAGRDGALVWFAMEFCPGGSLRDVLDQEGQAAPRLAARWVVELLDGLDVVHRAGLIHRDVKPSNMLRDADGRVKLADFGVAHHPESKVAFRTMQGSRIGSGPYLAPEVRSDASRATVQSDVFAAGATLYELLSGIIPVTLSVATRREAAIGQVPRAFQAVILAATDPDPARRPASAMAMRGELVNAANAWSKANHAPQDAHSWCEADPEDSGLFGWVRSLLVRDP